MSKKKKKDKDKHEKKKKKELKKLAALKPSKSASPRKKEKPKSSGNKDLSLKIKNKDKSAGKEKLKKLELEKVREKDRGAVSMKDKLSGKEKLSGKDGKNKAVAVAVERKAAPVAVRSEPVKLTKEMLETRARLQTMLGEMRRDIDHEVRGASERDLAHINDTSDMASDAAEGDLALRIAESETVEAEEIERAIEKIDNGTYGVCEMCSKPIGADRIKFLPYVTLCIKCQELAEIRRREEGDELDDLAEGSEADAENN